MSPRVPLTDLAAAAREIWPEVLDELTGTMLGGRYIGGPAVTRFEDEWAAYCGTTHAVGTANGTDALQLALEALDVGPGDDVVVPANTFVATAEAVVRAGATPRFADVDARTLLLTPRTLERALTARTRAVVVVHLFGQMPDMDALSAVARRAGILLLEDAAQAHGATWRGGRAGTFGHAGCFSFYPGKNLGAFGDAGAVVTSDGNLAARIRTLADHGRSAASRDEHVVVGANSRLDAVQAIVLSAKLRHLEAWTRARRERAADYRRALHGSHVRPLAVHPGAGHVYHQVVVRVPERDRVRAALGAAGIETGVHYPVPCHLQPAFAAWTTGHLPVSEQAAGEILSLPVSPYLGADSVDSICKVLLDAVGPRHIQPGSEPGDEAVAS
jgi:dTDP-4-amino-4,6-dideoxygalactose transaminase